jgi:Mlc titration factor MtfA (ptsG expression regulator)
VQQADLLAAANRLERDRLEKKLHLAAEQMKKERQLHEERLAIMASGAAKKEEELREELLATHSEEKKEMDQKVKSIEARLREYTKPWYQQRPRGQMY